MTPSQAAAAINADAPEQYEPEELGGNAEQLPELIMQSGNLPASVRELRTILAGSANFFDRGVPVRVIFPMDGGLPSAMPVTKHHVVMTTHQLCRPMKIKRNGEAEPTTLPDRAAQMYLDMFGEWNLDPLNGFSLSPLLSNDGGLRVAEGYDSESRLWCCRIPKLTVSARPSRQEAEAALHKLRHAFRTFPFADAARSAAVPGIETVDVEVPPARDESAFLVALLTACCRPSLWLAPGLLMTAPALSGAGSGKGLLVRAICTIAFGVAPRAFTSGNDRHELDKRLAAELVEANPAVFLDNANGIALRSDTLASVLTERPARVRILGQTRMVELNSTAFIAVTGNGLTVTEDLARRFVSCELDAHCEDPESRPFASGFLDQIQRERAGLLTAVLTIWRWGRQNSADLKKGKPLGSFECWAEWCRDPLLALGCRDPVERIETLKSRDPRRQRVVELFIAWWEHHGDNPVKANDLAEPVKVIADAQQRGRQYLATQIAGLAGTQAAGFVLTRRESGGKWSPATYSLRKSDATNAMGHGGHRGHRPSLGPNEPKTPPFVLWPNEPAQSEDPMPPMAPMTPMTPMPDGGDDDEVLPAGSEAEL